MKFTIVLKKTVVLHVEAENEVAARLAALDGDEGASLYADGAWDNAETELVSIDLET